MPHIDNNMPNNIFYSAFIGETIRIARLTLRFSDFLPKVWYEKYYGKVTKYENAIHP